MATQMACSPVKTLESNNSKVGLGCSTSQSPGPAVLHHPQQCSQGLMWDVVQFKDNLPGAISVNYCKAAR